MTKTNVKKHPSLEEKKNTLQPFGWEYDDHIFVSTKDPDLKLNLGALIDYCFDDKDCKDLPKAIEFFTHYLERNIYDTIQAFFEDGELQSIDLGKRSAIHYNMTLIKECFTAMLDKEEGGASWLKAK